MSKARLMQGNEACAEGALAAGVRFFGGYPITPSTEIAEGMAKMLPKVGGKFVQMEDEIASMGVVLGASLAGKKALTASSGPGISLKQELIGYAAAAEIPVVIVNSKVSVSTFEDSDRFIFEAVFLLPGVYRAGGTTTGAAIGLLLDVKQYS